MDEQAKRKALGEFIKTQRTQTPPITHGIAASAGVKMRRRTPGLRREEIAQLCGISVTWYTWIEQGRTVSVSPSALARIADALQLSRAKRAYLFELSGKKDPHIPDLVASPIPAEIVALVSNIKAPAYLLDRYWNVVASNRPAQALFTGWLDQKSSVKNLLHYTFCDPSAATFISDWEQRARRLVAEFRADCGMYLDDVQITAIVERLCADSAAFKLAWSLHDVVEKEGGERRFHHPSRGLLCYQQVNLRVTHRSELKLITLLSKAT
ncbi:helix-turn-helix transcriptional regulator [Glaciimonas soli]|nr:helix-turn-helix transcriptional regulator [Glaciimonas soli]